MAYLLVMYPIGCVFYSISLGEQAEIDGEDNPFHDSEPDWMPQDAADNLVVDDEDLQTTEFQVERRIVVFPLLGNCGTFSAHTNVGRVGFVACIVLTVAFLYITWKASTGIP